ncbi:D-serine dehydratase, partial [Bowmanella sp. Y57]|nr:D-serine dehydratase [Bowmanella yangjiangensis]
MILGKSLAQWCAEYPLLDELIALHETSWFNPGVAPVAQALADVGLSAADVADASARLQRFAPYLARVFPQTAGSGGIIESDILALPRMQAWLSGQGGDVGALWLKR